MIPHTYPSKVVDNLTKMQVGLLTNVNALQAWIDYIPVKKVNIEGLAVNSYDGYIATDELDVTGLQKWVDYIPVFDVSDNIAYTQAFSTDSNGYIPITGGVIPEISSPPEYIGVSARGVASVVTMPTHEAGDLLIIQYMTDSNGQFTSPPSGWTLLPVSKGYTSRFISLAYKIAQSNNEPILDVSSNVNDSVDSATWVFNIRGANPTNPINAQQNSFRNTGTVNGTIQGLTTTIDNCLILSIIASAKDSSTGGLSNWANPSLVSITESFDLGFTSDNGGTFGMAHGVKESSGVVANTTFTITSGTNFNLNNFTMLAINPI